MMAQPTLTWLLLLFVAVSHVSSQFTTVYMNNQLGTEYSDSSIRVEASLSRVYSPNTNSWIVLKTPDGFPVWYVRLQRLDVEGLLTSGSCNDYLNIYNGNSLTSPRLNSAPLCGTQTSIRTYYTTGSYLTVQFVSDATAELTGFELIATAAITGTCTSSTTQFQCVNSTNLCIAIGLRCDGFPHCANASDEQVAMCQGLQNDTNSALYGIIIGSIIGGIVLIIVLVLLIMYCVRERKYKLLLKKLRLERNQRMNQTGPAVLNEYPVTNMYRKSEFKKQFIDEEIEDKDWGLYYGPLYDKHYLAKIEKERLAEKASEESTNQEPEPNIEMAVADTEAEDVPEDKTQSQQGSHASLKSGALVSEKAPSGSRKPSSAIEMTNMDSNTPRSQQGSHASLKSGNLTPGKATGGSGKPSSSNEMTNMDSNTLRSQQGSHASLKSADLTPRNAPSDSRKPSSSIEMTKVDSNTPKKESLLPPDIENGMQPDSKGDGEALETIIV